MLLPGPLKTTFEVTVEVSIEEPLNDQHDSEGWLRGSFASGLRYFVRWFITSRGGVLTISAEFSSSFLSMWESVRLPAIHNALSARWYVLIV